MIFLVIEKRQHHILKDWRTLEVVSREVLKDVGIFFNVASYKNLNQTLIEKNAWAHGSPTFGVISLTAWYYRFG